MKFIIAVSIVQILVFNAEIQHSETFGKIKEFRVLEINSLFEIYRVYPRLLILDLQNS